MWGEPPCLWWYASSGSYFNSLAPCGANRNDAQSSSVDEAFQLTRPVWGEPFVETVNEISRNISTHSPRVGRTNKTCQTRFRQVHFNSLAPCGANLRNAVGAVAEFEFQLTRPVWGEPIISCSEHCVIHFNSLAPCGANPADKQACTSISTFQLTRPVWGEPVDIDAYNESYKISTHSPRVGRTKEMKKYEA